MLLLTSGVHPHRWCSGLTATTLSVTNGADPTDMPLFARGVTRGSLRDLRQDRGRCPEAVRSVHR
ncbi:hypothetical protein DLJ96_17025 [Actinotalea fermentans ATCC 43279 = JCM 9966 = DSM 3133]|nr:hypothetical protein DLJ96_17025 [Actinotalea fermentans ATCC 43279 = JCM 9966 = DSM 3133]